ncbi:MAG: tol-pal system-associated acyl-CoA thioesterase [Rhizobiales bacterium]|nr:tol-pal system-associated acyl-CoA thioesterase [Hyphomicrobiales bacterium]MBI3672121.1 tol-pal system-associated acyl-CoA thioesterase [Hyphomicrobiales bacterium]
MPEAWPDIAGRKVGQAHVLPIRVYYEDTDFGGVVYHANFLKFCERGRSDCLRLLGIHHHRLAGFNFVVRRMVCDFLKPARIDELLTVETRFGECAGARIELSQEVQRDSEALFRAAVTVALVDTTGRPCRLPAEIAAALDSLAKTGS